MSKAVELSLNTIVIAAIVLIVLVIVILIFTGRIGTFVGGTKNCVELGGTCTTDTDCNVWAEREKSPGSLGARIYGAVCPTDTQPNCCKLIYDASKSPSQ